MKIQNVTLGSDIEFFIQTRRGEPIPAIGMVGGTKEKPKSLGQGYYIQEDNVAIEFNIPVARNTKDFAQYVERGFHKCLQQVPAAFMWDEHASLEFNAEYIDGVPKALEFGCEPDINAWTRQINPRPKANNRYLRSAGGHVHIGWDNPDMETRFNLIRACDVFCSLPALKEDMDTRRRELYGKAGAMRIKPYGVEHRVLSNYWMFNIESSYHVANRYMEAVNFINNGHTVEEADQEDIVNCVNTGWNDKAKQLLAKYRVLAR